MRSTAPLLLLLLAAGEGCLGRSQLSGPGLLLSTSRLLDSLVYDDIYEEVTPLREQVRANVIAPRTRRDLEYMLLWPKLISALMAGWTASLCMLHLKEKHFSKGLLFGALAMECLQVGFNCALRRYHSLQLTRGYEEKPELHLLLLLEGTWFEAVNKAMGKLLSRLHVTPAELLMLRWHERFCDPLDWNCVL